MLRIHGHGLSSYNQGQCVYVTVHSESLNIFQLNFGLKTVTVYSLHSLKKINFLLRVQRFVQFQLADT